MAEYIESEFNPCDVCEVMKCNICVLHELAIKFAKQPAADEAPVVRCRHCQSHHWEQEPCHGKTVHYCEKLKAEVWPDFFCGYGKRKGGD